MKQKLLLHVCCAPCSTHVIEKLKEDYELTLFFYNPCIEPLEEYELRLKNTQKLAKELETPLIVADYNNSDFRKRVKGHEKDKEGDFRCQICFKQRLEETALAAKQYNMDIFTTTLTISPYKNTEIINKIGKKIGQQFNIKFLEADFKKNNGYRNSIELSKKHNLYRQKYCGCLFSKK